MFSMLLQPFIDIDFGQQKDMGEPSCVLATCNVKVHEICEFLEPFWQRDGVSRKGSVKLWNEMYQECGCRDNDCARNHFEGGQGEVAISRDIVSLLPAKAGDDTCD